MAMELDGDTVASVRLALAAWPPRCAAPPTRSRAARPAVGRAAVRRQAALARDFAPDRHALQQRYRLQVAQT